VPQSPDANANAKPKSALRPQSHEPRRRHNFPENPQRTQDRSQEAKRLPKGLLKTSEKFDDCITSKNSRANVFSATKKSHPQDANATSSNPNSLTRYKQALTNFSRTNNFESHKGVAFTDQKAKKNDSGSKNVDQLGILRNFEKNGKFLGKANFLEKQKENFSNSGNLLTQNFNHYRVGLGQRGSAVKGVHDSEQKLVGNGLGMGLGGDVFGNVNLRDVKSCLGEKTVVKTVVKKVAQQKSKKKNVSFEGKEDRPKGPNVESSDVYPRLLREFNARLGAGLGIDDGIWNHKKIVNTKISLGDVRQRMQQAQDLRKGMDQIMCNV
jgi:hypothetical protein